MIDLHKAKSEKITVKMRDLDTNTPFRESLVYSAPARGTWTIAHTSMLIPHAHQIFVCPEGCLRGVVLSAAEYNGLDRFSMITVKEGDLYDDNMENLFIDGVTDIIESLPERPPAVLIYTSCVQHFINCDEQMVYRVLRERFPDIDFIDCYMFPTMRKSMSPDEIMARQLYAALEDVEKDPKSVNVIGSYYALDHDCEIRSMLAEAGYTLRDICDTTEYSQYKDMAKSSLNIYNAPVAIPAVKELKRRLGQEFIYMPFTWDTDEIADSLKALSEVTGAKLPDIERLRSDAESALKELKELIGDTQLQIDYTATPKPFSLAAMLVKYGMNVTEIYADGIPSEEDKAVAFLKENAPDLELCAATDFRARLIDRDAAGKNGIIIAIGQKAAYYTNTKHMVNMIVNNGLYGYTGIIKLCKLIEDAYKNESDVRSIISIKGWGCSC